MRQLTEKNGGILLSPVLGVGSVTPQTVTSQAHRLSGILLPILLFLFKDANLRPCRKYLHQ